MTLRTKHTLTTTLALVLAGLAAPQAMASGFQLREQSPSAQGNSFAGVTAGGSDISVMFFNPASMTQFGGTQFSFGASYVAPKAKYSNGTASPFTLGFGTYPAAPTSHSNAAVSAALPALNLMYSLSNDLKLGFSVNVPFGLTTDYDASFIGRYHALKSELKTIDISPSLAYRMSPQFSVGVALVARKAEAEITNAVDFGTIMMASTLNPTTGAPTAATPLFAAAGYGPGLQDGTGGLKGDAWGFGFKLGATWQATETFRIGVAYQSAVDITLKGDGTFEIPALPSVPAAGQTSAALLLSLQGRGFKNGAGEAELNLPSMTSLGFNYDISKTFAIQGEVAQTGWSSFKELRVKFTDNIANNLYLKESITEEEWKDTWFYSLGMTWKASEAWTLRAGLASDKGAVEDAYRTPRIPDGDRTWFSAGLGYALSKNTSIDMAVTHITVKDGPVDLRALPTGTTPSTSPNTYRGNLGGTFKNSIDIVSVSARFIF